MTYPALNSQVDLNFEDPIQSNRLAVNLNFKAEAVPPLEASLSAKIKISARANFFYDKSNFVGVNKSAKLVQQTSIILNTTESLRYGDSLSLNDQQSIVNTAPNIQYASNKMRWIASKQLNLQNKSVFNNGNAKHGQALFNWRYGELLNTLNTIVYNESINITNQLKIHYWLGENTSVAEKIVFNNSKQLSQDSLIDWSLKAVANNKTLIAKWDEGILIVDKGVWKVPPTPQPAELPQPIVLNLQLCQELVNWPSDSLGAYLIFGFNWCHHVIPDAPIYILPSSFYMSVHEIFATTPELDVVPIYNLSLSSDYQSWCWQFSATGPESLMDQFQPTINDLGVHIPKVINISVNGIQYKFIVERRQLMHSFGKKSVNISGRSVSALLASPYSAKQSRSNIAATTAQQLCDTGLNLTGFTLNWQLEDWLVPANSFSNYGTTIEATMAIVNAAGGFLQSNRNSNELIAQHAYPHLLNREPWNWGSGTADVELAADAIISEDIEPIYNTPINAVYVSGTTTGVTALVKRTGSDASQLAEMITDSLITAPAAARQRGLLVLGSAGAKNMIKLNLPVLVGQDQPGILSVGQLVQINKSVPYRGMIRAVNVSYDAPKLRQTITLEQHLL